jgi:hypothetical protein
MKTQQFLETNNFDSENVNAPKLSWCLGSSEFGKVNMKHMKREKKKHWKL